MTTVTIAICTHNRAQDVEECCAALAVQVKEAGLPIIIVDSASDPVNAATLYQLAARHDAKYVRLETPGLSLARNAAHQHASSEWIAYLDDDSIPHPEWAPSLLSVLFTVSPQVAVVGGKIVPLWPSDAVVNHITDRWKLLLSCVETAGSGLVSEGYNICGANFAVRRSALELAEQFPVTLGRFGSRLMSGEEAYLIEKLLSIGYLSIYDENFVVSHRISAERLELGWIAQRAYWEGVSRIRILEELGKSIPPSMNMIKIAATLPALAVLKLVSPNPDYTIRYNMALGSLLFQLKQKTTQIKG
jgi:GT2 family glycosyltransferase